MVGGFLVRWAVCGPSRSDTAESHSYRNQEGKREDSGRFGADPHRKRRASEADEDQRQLTGDEVDTQSASWHHGLLRRAHYFSYRTGE
ncbi:hypothetical protein EAO72_24590 [Streptomyces sp. or43]|nr:hypothetical protein EAO72_24590 [Streptomyces sp. or43]